MKASLSQVGGDHYKDRPIQPAQYCQLNRLNHCEASIVKYATRHADKNGAEDVKKIIHYAQLILEWEYPEPESTSTDASATNDNEAIHYLLKERDDLKLQLLKAEDEMDKLRLELMQKEIPKNDRIFPVTCDW